MTPRTILTNPLETWPHLKEHRGNQVFGAPEGRGERRRDSRNHKAGVFSWKGAGPQAFRLSFRKSSGFPYGSWIPGRCFRKSRRRPRAPSKLSGAKQRL